MKKTILLLALGLASITLTNCSRGYGCPYTSIEKESTQKSKSESGTLVFVTEENESERITK